MAGGSRTKADYAYRVLRQMIVTGKVPAGQPIEESEFVAIIEVGRTPIRESLKRLAQEQFIRWPAHRTPYVSSLSLEDVHRLYESRMVMEVPAAVLAASRATPDQHRMVKERFEELQRATEEGDVYESIEADHALHIAITRGSNNKFLTEAVDRLNCSSLRLWYVAHERSGLATVAQHHEDLINALYAGDPERTEQAVRHHIRTSYERQISLHLDGLSTLPTSSSQLSRDLPFDG
ncbi:GntR family transcriptional regulator [Nocardiopsis oceani]